MMEGRVLLMQKVWNNVTLLMLYFTLSAILDLNITCPSPVRSLVPL